MAETERKLGKKKNEYFCLALDFSYLCHQNALYYGCKTYNEVPEAVVG